MAEASLNLNGDAENSNKELNVSLSDSDSEIEIIQELKVTYTEHKCNLCSEGEFLIDRLLRYGGVLNDKHKFACEICDKGFAQKSSLTKHLKKHSKTNITSTESPNSSVMSPTITPYKTNVTSKESPNSSVMSPAITPYSCTVCKKFYKTERTLRTHSNKRHFGRHICEICKLLFSDFNSFKSHCDTHKN
ncbi:adult enhancer factor 1 [Parasteatoda tepidariorum]|uniref:adult enhancer factor 1 n=1 Tax=Parasteatoda tepidariorum TaxID=114398 RepID=UPI001C728078|nr:adult enhancer factor 1 [Parasteatoda tepidariorum]